MAASILLLEDDDALRGVLADLLLDHGYQVQAAANGEQAVRLASQQDFDLIVTDVRMQGIDGLDALQKVQQQQPGVSSMVVTGYSSEADSIRAIRLGVGDYLKKPFSLESFLASVSRLLAERRREGELLSREAAVERTLQWALETVANSLEFDASEEGTPRLALQAHQASRALGLALVNAQEVQTAVLLGRLASREVLPEFMARAMGERVQALLREARSAEGRSAPAQIVAAFLNEPAEPADPTVREAVQAARQGQAVALAEDAGRSRALLALARALEESREWESAREAYAKILAGRQLSAERVDAHVGLARVTLELGLSPEPHLQAAAGEARLLGPELASRVLLDLAGLVARFDPERARGQLREAAESCRRLGLADAEAQARLIELALSGSTEDPTPLLHRLARPEQVEALSAHCGLWLPWLLERPGSDERALRFFCAQFARQLSVLLPRLSPAARLALAGLLPRGTGGWSEGCLTRLQSDPDPDVRAAAARTGGAAPEPPLLRLYSFGPFEVFLGDRRFGERDFKSRKVRYLLACLVSRRGRPLQDETLIEAFWPEDKAQMSNLYAAASYLRSNLKVPGADVNLVLRSEGSFQLNPACPRWHDLEEFEVEEERARAARAQGQLEQALSSWQHMVRLYRGPYLEGCNLEWAVHQRVRLQGLVTEALEGLAGHALAGKQPEVARECGLKLVSLDPTHSEGHRLVMQALIDLGRAEEALKQFAHCKRVLASELGLEPGIELLRAYQAAQVQLSVPPG